MKKITFIALIGAALLVISGCSGAPKVKMVDTDTRVDLSGRWNDSDVRQVCATLIADALASPRIDSYIDSFAAKHRGEYPTVIIGAFRNESSEHIDTTIISGMMRTAIINSGKLEFVEGGAAREDIRAEREDQQYNANEDTAAQWANETGANFTLQGSVRTIVEQVGNQSIRSYFVTASITNMETNRILWEGSNNDIKKSTTQPKAKL
jgi:uncharacterized protein (TIGR02722 family)